MHVCVNRGRYSQMTIHMFVYVHTHMYIFISEYVYTNTSTHTNTHTHTHTHTLYISAPILFPLPAVTSGYRCRRNACTSTSPTPFLFCAHLPRTFPPNLTAFWSTLGSKITSDWCVWVGRGSAGGMGYTYLHARMRTYVHACIHTHIHTHTHTCTHTHTHSLFQS